MAEIWRYDGGGVPRKVREIWRYDASGVPRKARELWRYDAGGVARKVFSGGFELTQSTTSVTGLGTTFSPGGTALAITGSVTVTPVGGSGSFSYAWALLSGTPASGFAATAASTTFRRSQAAPTKIGGSNTFSGVYRCTVTDQSTGDQRFADVTVITRHLYDA